MTLVLLIAALLSQPPAPIHDGAAAASESIVARRSPAGERLCPGRRSRGPANAGVARSGRVLARRHRRQDGRQYEESARALSEAGSSITGLDRAPRHLLHHRCGCRRALRAVDSGRSRPAGHPVLARLHIAARSARRALPFDAGAASAAQSGSGIQGGRSDPGAERRAIDRARGEAGAESGGPRGSRQRTRSPSRGYLRTPRRAGTQTAEHSGDASRRHGDRQHGPHPQ